MYIQCDRYHCVLSVHADLYLYVWPMEHEPPLRPSYPLSCFDAHGGGAGRLCWLASGYAMGGVIVLDRHGPWAQSGACRNGLLPRGWFGHPSARLSLCCTLLSLRTSIIINAVNSAAPSSPFSRRFNRNGEGLTAGWLGHPLLSMLSNPAGVLSSLELLPSCPVGAGTGETAAHQGKEGFLALEKCLYRHSEGWCRSRTDHIERAGW